MPTATRTLAKFTRIPIDAAALEAAYRETPSATALEARFGCSRNTIIRRLREADPRRPFGTNALAARRSKARLKAMASACAAGKSVKDICRQHNAHSMTVYRACKLHGVRLHKAKNPIRRPRSPAHAAYAAGIIDGEGSILISVAKRSTGCLALSVVASMTEPEALQRIATTIGGNLTGPHATRNDRHKAFYRWHAASRQAAAFLRIIRPYLTVKQKQASIALAFQRTRRCGRSRSTADGTQFRDAILRERRRRPK